MQNHWIYQKLVIVTGGASGIGFGIAREAALNGAIVVIADVNQEAGSQAEQTINKLEGQARFIRTDVTKVADIKNLVSQAKSLGPIQFLANSAGIQTYGTAETTSVEDWDRCLDINLKSMFLVSREVLPEIRNNGGGGIVNISSIQGLRCQKNVLAYATSKAAVIGLTRSMGLDHGKEGIFVNCICPGSIDTPMLRYGAGKHGPVDKVLEEWAEHHPIGRIGSPTEIAKTAMFLWSPDSNFMIGQAIIADGGLGSVIL